VGAPLARLALSEADGMISNKHTLAGHTCSGQLGPSHAAGRMCGNPSLHASCSLPLVKRVVPLPNTRNRVIRI
jgi:hypothetical protein